MTGFISLLVHHPADPPDVGGTGTVSRYVMRSAIAPAALCRQADPRMRPMRLSRGPHRRGWAILTLPLRGGGGVMPVVGDRVEALPSKAGQLSRTGVVTGLSGSLITVRWD